MNKVSPINPFSPFGLSGRSGIIIIELDNSILPFSRKNELVQYIYSIYGLSGQWINSKSSHNREVLWQKI
jgi:hypothetical protein